MNKIHKIVVIVAVFFIGYLIGNSTQSITRNSEMQKYRKQKTSECSIVKKDNELEIPTASTKLI